MNYKMVVRNELYLDKAFSFQLFMHTPVDCTWHWVVTKRVWIAWNDTGGRAPGNLRRKWLARSFECHFVVFFLVSGHANISLWRPSQNGNLIGWCTWRGFWRWWRRWWKPSRRRMKVIAPWPNDLQPTETSSSSSFPSARRPVPSPWPLGNQQVPLGS